MILLYILLAVNCFALAAFARTRSRSPLRLPAAPEPNVFGTVILPEPDDPRWTRKKELGCSIDDCKVVMLQFGCVHSCIVHGVYVDGLDLGRVHDKERCLAYARAVRDGFAARKAMDEIEAPPAPALPPVEALPVTSV